MIDWGDGTTVIANVQDAHAFVHAQVEIRCEAVGASRAVLCLSDDFDNHRFRIDAAYKSNRSGSERPELLYPLKEWIMREFRAKRVPTLEADDVMGILATRHPDRYVIVSEDKDMRTIPARVYHPHKPELGVMDISELDADRMLCWQTIVGDQVDGYTGAPRVGPRSIWADALIDADRDELWDLVLCAYGSVGLSERAAIKQARLAFIFRDWIYDKSTRSYGLWTPECLECQL